MFDGKASHDLFFELMKNRSLGISAVFYELVHNDSKNQRVSKVKENYCRCGTLLNIGENDCPTCKTTVLVRKDLVHKSPNAKSKASEESKRLYQTFNSGFKSKVTQKLEKK
jgi:hypothetical protein